MERKKWEANRSKKGGILNGREKREANNSKSKTIIVQKWIGKKKWEANKSKKKPGILNGTEKMGSK